MSIYHKDRRLIFERLQELHDVRSTSHMRAHPKGCCAWAGAFRGAWHPSWTKDPLEAHFLGVDSRRQGLEEGA